ncbi:Segregation and condensation protein B [Lachnospiraceae bacterium TWA4]|nr:Segregation and condensation protein B [Lachnospiraceae bacterium TWA4]
MLEELQSTVESILFTMGGPVKVSVLVKVLGQPKEVVESVIKQLEDNYEKLSSGLSILRVEDGYQLCTKSKNYPYLIKMLGYEPRKELSEAALEVLSIVAYRQPVTKGEISKIRGVNSDKVVNRLVDYGLIMEKGREVSPGRPLLFGTTDEFLRRFGLNSLTELDTK